MFSLGQASYFWSHLNCHPLFHKTLARVLERGALGHRQIVSAINYNAPNQLFSNQWFALPSNILAPGSLDFVIFVAIILTFTFILNLIFENFICNAISNVLLAINVGSGAVWKLLTNHLFWRTKASVTMLIRKSYKSEYFLLTCVVMVRQFLTDGIGDESKWIKLSVGT